MGMAWNVRPRQHVNYAEYECAEEESEEAMVLSTAAEPPRERRRNPRRMCRTAASRREPTKDPDHRAMVNQMRAKAKDARGRRHCRRLRARADLQGPARDDGETLMLHGGISRCTGEHSECRSPNDGSA